MLLPLLLAAVVAPPRLPPQLQRPLPFVLRTRLVPLPPELRLRPLVAPPAGFLLGDFPRM